MRKRALWMALGLAAFAASEILAPFLAVAADDPYAPARRRIVVEQLLSPGRENHQRPPNAL